MIVQPLFQDPFSPKLFSSPPLPVSTEQRMYLREVLEIGASDSRFAEKMYNAIVLILTAGNTIPPVLTSLTPNSAEIGDANFTLHVHGTGFKSGSTIIFNGGEEPTTFVSATEVTTGVDMSTVSGPIAVPIMVQNPDGVLSNAMNFTFTDGSVVLSGAKKTEPPVGMKTPEPHTTPKMEVKK